MNNQVMVVCPHCGRSSPQQMNEDIASYSFGTYCKKNDCLRQMNVWVKYGTVVRVLKEGFDH